MRLIDAGDLWSDIMMLPHNGDMISSEDVEQAIMNAPVVDAVILPCKIGETVYVIRECSCHVYGQWNNPSPRKKCSEKVYLGKKLRAYHCGYVTETHFEVKLISDFGKKVFLTREEAEAALAKMKG